MDERIALQEQMGRNLYMARRRAHLTQEQLAEMTGVSASYYANIERGRKGMHPETLRRLADALHISVDSIIYGDRLDRRQICDIVTMLRDQPDSFVNCVAEVIACLLRESRSRQEERGREEVLL